MFKPSFSLQTFKKIPFLRRLHSKRAEGREGTRGEDARAGASVNHLVAKALFDELTLGEILELAKPDQIDVYDRHEENHHFRRWTVANGRVEFFWPGLDDFFFDGELDLPNPEMSLPLNSKVLHKNGRFYVRGMQIVFNRFVPFTLASVLSPEKPDQD